MTHRFWIALASTAIAGSMFGCSDDFTPKAADAGVEGSAPDSGAPDVTVDAFEAGPVLLSAVRLADWVPDAPPLDVCIAPSGSGFPGAPLMASFFSAPDAGGLEDGGNPAGLAFPQVSSYVNVPVGQYDVRLVAAGSTDCSSPIGSDLTGVSPLLFNTFNTLAILGELAPEAGAPSLRAVLFSDDHIAPSSNDPSAPYVGLRFINAGPNVPSAEIGSYDNGTYGVNVAGVAFGASSASSTEADRNGYVRTVPMAAGQDIAVRASDDYAGLGQVVTTALESVAGGAVATIALVAPVPGAADAGASPVADAAAGARYAPVGSLVVCIDNAIVVFDDGTLSPLASCTVGQ
jgi:hypothetical protein